MKFKFENAKETAIDRINETGAKAMVKAANTIGKGLNTRFGKMIFVLPIIISMMSITVSAEADGFISNIIALLQTWIPRLGGMIIVVGGIQLGVGFKDDNADGKTRGMQCMIGGAIVAAIGGMVNF